MILEGSRFCASERMFCDYWIGGGGNVLGKSSKEVLLWCLALQRVKIFLVFRYFLAKDSRLSMILPAMYVSSLQPCSRLTFDLCTKRESWHPRWRPLPRAREVRIDSPHVDVHRRHFHSLHWCLP
jgi:hypothetical protein